MPKTIRHKYYEYLTYEKLLEAHKKSCFYPENLKLQLDISKTRAYNRYNKIVTMKKKKYDNIYFQRIGDGEIPIINAYGELWSNIPN